MEKKEVFDHIQRLAHVIHFSGESHGHNIAMSTDYCSHEYCQKTKKVREALEDVYDKCWMYDELCD